MENSQNLERSNNPTPEKSINVLIFLLSIVLLIIIVSVLFLSRREIHETKNTIVSHAGLVITKENTQLMLPSVPHFENVILDNLPSASYNKLYEVSNNFIVVENNKLVEYDPSNKDILKQSDYSILDCFNSSIMINNFLYVFCQGYQTKAQRGIYVIDVTQGKLVKRYNDLLPKDKEGMIGVPEWYTIPNLINGRLASKGNILWVGTWDGVFRIDTKTDNISFYNMYELGFSSQCNSYSIYANAVNVWVTPGAISGCVGGVSLYDNSHNSWNTFKAVDFHINTKSDINLTTTAYSRTNIYLEYLIGNSQAVPNIRLVTYNQDEKTWEKVVDMYNYQDIRKIKSQYFPDATIVYDGEGSSKDTYQLDENANLPDISKDLPTYVGISPMINSKYYLFTSNGIYTLSKGEFPKLLKTISPADLQLNGQKVYISYDEKYAVLAGNNHGGPYFDGPYYSIHLIDIEQGKVYNLVLWKTAYIDFSNGTFTPTSDGVIFEDSKKNVPIFSVNFLDKTATLLESISPTK